MNIYGKHGLDYINAGFAATPGKPNSKLPAIKEWTTYCHRLPEEAEFLSWANSFHDSNIDICLGEASGVIALDFDCVDEQIIVAIDHLMPSSPVERIGSKGWVRFFQYSGEQSFVLKFNGGVVLEILSNNKKVTIPPSMHPSGMQYKWTDKSLLDVDKKQLPRLPIGLISEVQNKLKFSIAGTEINSPLKLINGRNDALSSYCGTLISEGKPLDEAVKLLVKYDTENHKTPLFSDISENGHNEAFTNALAFYSNHLKSINTRRFRDHREYEIPITASSVNETYVEEILKKKEQRQEKQKVSKENGLKIRPPGALGMLYDFVLENSYIPQPAFALSSALSIMGTLCGRKTIFQGVASNLYLLNISSSGSGKDAPMQMAKKVLTDINALHLLGSGDYVSDASLMDELSVSPVRLDVIDEASGLLKNVTTSTGGYAGKMADILCELYTTSTSRFLGRMTAEGRKGVCDRPNVTLLCATTPTGFKESVNRSAIEKGLLGRFLIFMGNPSTKARRLSENTSLSYDLKKYLLFWKDWSPPSDNSYLMKLGDSSQNVYNVPATEAANMALGAFFEEIDRERCAASEDSKFLPIISRLYQQTLKIALIAACSRVNTGTPTVNQADVEFAIEVVNYYRDIMWDVVDNHIFSNDIEAKYMKVLKIVERAEPHITQTELNDATRWLTSRERENIIRELITDRKILAYHNTNGTDCQVCYTGV